MFMPQQNILAKKLLKYLNLPYRKYVIVSLSTIAHHSYFQSEHRDY